MKKSFSKFSLSRSHRNREQRRKLRETQQTLQLWAWLEKLFEVGQLSFDHESHRLFITQTMAELMLQNGVDGWVQSVHNIYMYVHWRQTQRAWEDFMHKEELKAVREALTGPAPNPSPEGAGKSTPHSATVSGASVSELTPADIERIKRARRVEIAMSDMEPPKEEPFEFFIIPDSKEAKVEPIGVGYYDPTTGQMEVATWDEVKGYLQK